MSKMAMIREACPMTAILPTQQTELSSRQQINANTNKGGVPEFWTDFWLRKVGTVQFFLLSQLAGS
jgi:hypothetical protein